MSIEKEIYQHLYKRLNPKSIVIDIGAYVGTISKKICDNIRGNPNNFYLIEACPKNFKVMRRNCSNYRLYHMAIGDINGETIFYIGNHKLFPGSSQANSLYREFIEPKIWNTKPKEVVVKSMTLNTFVHSEGIKNINLLKVNCEGSEYKIFNVEQTVLDRVQYLYLQIHRKSAVFLTKEMDAKRSSIVKMLLKNFNLIIEQERPPDNPNDKGKGHIHTLWERKK